MVSRGEISGARRETVLAGQRGIPSQERLDEIEIELSGFQAKIYDLLAMEQALSSRGKARPSLERFTSEYKKGRITGKSYLNLFQRHALKKYPSSKPELEILAGSKFAEAFNSFSRSFSARSGAGAGLVFRKNPNYKINSVIFPIARLFFNFGRPGAKQGAKAVPKAKGSAPSAAGRLFSAKSAFEETPVEIRQEIGLPQAPKRKAALPYYNAKALAIQEALRAEAPGAKKARQKGLPKAGSEEQEASIRSLTMGQGELPGMGAILKKLASSLFTSEKKLPRKDLASEKIQKPEQASAGISGIADSFKRTLYNLASGGEEEAYGLGAVYQPESMTSLREKFFVGGKEHTLSRVQASNPNQLELIPGYSSMQILEEEAGTNIYYVFEPELVKLDIALIEFVKAKLVESISLEDLDRERLFAKVDHLIRKHKLKLSEEQKQKLVYYLSRDLFGLGKIEPLMHDPFIEDIECDGVNIPVFLVHRKYGHLPTNIVYSNLAELEDFVIKLAQISKGYVSYASPLLDAILPDGSRVNAVLTQSVSTKGPTFTIRRFPEEPFCPVHLLEFGTLPASMLAYLWTVIEHKKNILITGPTAAGKTTMLNAMAMFFPAGDRVVSIEDTRELNIEHENWLPQVSRRGFGPPDASGQRFGEVTLMDLVKESFRQRPDYLVIGEVRGEETYIMFQGMASGHCCLATMHGRSVDDLVSRLTTPPINLHPSLLDSLDLVLLMGFKGTETIQRALAFVAEIEGYNPKSEKLEYNNLYSVSGSRTTEEDEIEAMGFGLPQPESVSQETSSRGSGAAVTSQMRFSAPEILPITYRSTVLKKISEQERIPHKRLLELIQKRNDFLEQLHRDKVFNYREFALRLSAYRQKERKEFRFTEK